MNVVCPSGKLSYAKREAKIAANSVSRRTRRPLVAYCCRHCGRWHLATKTSRFA